MDPTHGCEPFQKIVSIQVFSIKNFNQANKQETLSSHPEEETCWWHRNVTMWHLHDDQNMKSSSMTTLPFHPRRHLRNKTVVYMIRSVLWWHLKNDFIFTPRWRDSYIASRAWLPLVSRLVQSVWRFGSRLASIRCTSCLADHYAAVLNISLKLDERAVFFVWSSRKIIIWKPSLSTRTECVSHDEHHQVRTSAWAVQCPIKCGMASFPHV